MTEATVSDSNITERNTELARLGRRAFLRAAAFAAAAVPIASEATLAQAKMASQSMECTAARAVIINANENPLGPCKAACEAITRFCRWAVAMIAWASSPP